MIPSFLFCIIHMDNINKQQLWRSRIAIAFHFLFCGFIFASWAARIPSFKIQFNLNEADLGATLFMLPLGSFIALPFAGWAVDRFGSKWMMVISTIAYVAALNFLPYMPSVFHLAFILFFFGFIGDVMNIAMNTQGVDIQHLFQKPILSSFHAMWSLGALLGAVIGGFTLEENLSTATHYWIVAIPVIAITLFSLPFLIKKDTEKEKEKKLFVLPEKELWMIGIVCLFSTLCEGAMADWSALYYQEAQGVTNVVSTAGFTAYAFAMTIGRFAGDKLILMLKYKKVLLLDGLLIAGGMLIALSVSNPIIIMFGFALVGFGVSTIIPIAYSVAASSKTMKASIALAAVSTIGFSGFLIGPPLIGFIAHETGLRVALLLVAILGIAILWLGRKFAH